MAMTPHRYIVSFHQSQKETIIPIAHPYGIWVSLVFAGIVKTGLRRLAFSISASDVPDFASYVFLKKFSAKIAKTFYIQCKIFGKKFDLR